MKSRSVPTTWRRFFVLGAKNLPVEVVDRSEWSRWMSEHELLFRRTVLDESGVTVTTRFRSMSEARTGEAVLFVTRISGMGAGDNKSYATRTLDEARTQHERVL